MAHGSPKRFSSEGVVNKLNKKNIQIRFYMAISTSLYGKKQKIKEEETYMYIKTHKTRNKLKPVYTRINKQIKGRVGVITFQLYNTGCSSKPPIYIPMKAKKTKIPPLLADHHPYLPKKETLHIYMSSTSPVTTIVSTVSIISP